MVTLIMYSHTSCSDLWNMFCSQVEKYLSVERKVVFTDKTDWTRDGWDIITYDDSWSFPENVSRCLDQIDTETCMFHLEDMPLYDNPNESKLTLLEEAVRTTAIDYVKLIRGIDPLSPTWIPGLFKVPVDSPLPVCDTTLYLEKTKRLKELFDRCMVDFSGNTARGFEPFAQKPARDMSLFGTLPMTMNLKWVLVILIVLPIPTSLLRSTLVNGIHLVTKKNLTFYSTSII